MPMMLHTLAAASTPVKYFEGRNIGVNDKNKHTNYNYRYNYRYYCSTLSDLIAAIVISINHPALPHLSPIRHHLSLTSQTIHRQHRLRANTPLP